MFFNHSDMESLPTLNSLQSAILNEDTECEVTAIYYLHYILVWPFFWCWCIDTILTRARKLNIPLVYLEHATLHCPCSIRRNWQKFYRRVQNNVCAFLFLKTQGKNRPGKKTLLNKTLLNKTLLCFTYQCYTIFIRVRIRIGFLRIWICIQPLERIPYWSGPSIFKWTPVRIRIQGYILQKKMFLTQKKKFLSSSFIDFCWRKKIYCWTRFGCPHIMEKSEKDWYLLTKILRLDPNPDLY